MQKPVAHLKTSEISQKEAARRKDTARKPPSLGKWVGAEEEDTTPAKTSGKPWEYLRKKRKGAAEQRPTESRDKGRYRRDNLGATSCGRVLMTGGEKKKKVGGTIYECGKDPS